MADEIENQEQDELISTVIKLSRKPEAGAHHSSGWKVALADLMTSLFASFLVLWLIASTSPEGRIEIASVFKQPSVRNSIPGNTDNNAKENNGSSSSIINRSGGKLAPEKQNSSSEQRQKNLKQINAQLKKRLKKQIGDYVKITFDDKTIVITIKGDTLYGAGSYQANPRDEETILDIADILVDATAHIKIEGHSDNQPVRNSLLESNYELSALRAARIAWIFNIVGVEGDRITPIGLGQNFPADTNATAEGRMNNRRVIITINEPPPPELMPNAE